MPEIGVCRWRSVTAVPIPRRSDLSGARLQAGCRFRAGLLTNRTVDGIRLLFRKGDERLLQLRVNRSEVLVGRASTSDVMVPDESVPETAARLLDQGNERFLLSDLTEGQLLVNGAPARGGMIVQSGDRLSLGGYILELQTGPERTRGGRTGVLHEARPDPDDVAYLRMADDLIPVPRVGTFDIGTETDNSLVLDDPFISAYHCRIRYDGQRWRIEDLDSTNGTLVNGLRVRGAELPSEARIGLGQVILTFSSRSPASGVTPRHGMIAVSSAMRGVFQWVERFADAEEPVLVVGASGTGKEGVSRALHDASSRRRGPYLALNCGALASSIIESELFGHVKGAFTGATHEKKGAFEAASGGTLFLDEIGELPLELQPKLLRVLETKTVRRVGGTHEISVNPRIVAATHRNLEELVEQGLFREDLFHRLFVLTIPIPPLAERPDDVEALARHFLETQSAEPKTLEPGALEVLRGYRWPGNVRELRNVLVRAVLTTDGPRIRASDLQFSRDAFVTRSRPRSPYEARREGLEDPAERAQLETAIEQAGGNRAAAARRLGMSKSTFYDKVRRLGLDPKKPGPG